MIRGEVYEVNLNPIVGSEQSRVRPCVVVQRTVPVKYDNRNPMTVIVPLSDANGKPGDRLNPFVPQGTAGTTKDSRVICQQVRAVDKSRVGRKYGDLPPDIMKLVDDGLRAILDL